MVKRISLREAGRRHLQEDNVVQLALFILDIARGSVLARTLTKERQVHQHCLALFANL
jgi:hypothetical protein